MVASKPLKAIRQLQHRARSLASIGQLVDAAATCADLLSVVASHFGDRSLEAATTMKNLGWLFCESGNLVEAESQLLAALQITRARLGDFHPFCVETFDGLATISKLRGEEEGSRTYAAAAAFLGTAASDSAAYSAFSRTEMEFVVLDRQVRVLSEAGLYGKALPLANQAATLAAQMYPDEHPLVLQRHLSIAAIQCDIGAYELAKQTLESVLGRVSGVYYPLPQLCADLLQTYGVAAFCRGDFANAVKSLRSAVALLEDGIGPKEPRTSRARIRLAWVLRESGELGAAEQLCSTAYQALQSNHWASSLDIADVFSARAAIARELGKLDSAAELLSEATQIYREVDHDHPRVSRSFCDRAELMLFAASAQDALGLYSKSLPSLSARYANQIACLHSSIRYADCLLLCEAYPAAIVALGEVLPKLFAALGESHPEYGLALVSYGLAGVLDNRLTDAVSVMERGCEIVRARLGAGSPRFAESLFKAALGFSTVRQFNNAREYVSRARGVLADLGARDTPYHQLFAERARLLG